MRKTIILFAMFGLVATCVAATAGKTAKKVNFSGTWLLDSSKSKIEQSMGRGGGRGMGRGGGMGRRYPGGGSRGGGRTGEGRGGPGALQMDSSLVIDQTDDALKVTHNFDGSGAETQGFTQTFKLDGSESVNTTFRQGGEIKSRTSWDKDKLVTLGSQELSGRGGASGAVMKQEFSLSKDGKVLTVKTTLTTQRGEVTSKQVFTRQTDAMK